MTVAESSTPIRNDYQGDGSQTLFNFTFNVQKAISTITGKNYTIKVILTENNVDTIQTENTHYTVVLNSSNTGTITFATAPTATQKITFLSSIPISQEASYIDNGNGKFSGSSHELTLDKAFLLFKEFKEIINRSILLPDSSNLNNISVPISTENANKAIVVNSSGNNLTSSSLIDINRFPITAFAETILDDTTNTQARATLDAEQKANSLTEKSSVVANDKFIIADSQDSNNSKKVALSNIVLTGEIKAWASSSVPSRYLECNGAEVAISSYGNLSTAIYVGDSNNADTDLVFGYKTDGSGTRSTSGTHIKLPDLRGEFIRGWDNSRGIDSSRKLGSYQADAFQGHYHNVRQQSQAASNSHTNNNAVSSSFSGAANNNGNNATTIVSDGSSGAPRTASETRPRNISLMYIIKT